MNVNDSDQPKAPRFQHPCETAFITNVTNDDLEGVPSVQSLVRGWSSFGATGVLLTSTFLPDLLCFPGFEDGIVCICCILIGQEGDIECPQQPRRSEKQESKKKKTRQNFIT